LCVHKFTRIRDKEQASITSDRTEEDEEDPDSVQNTPFHKMDATHNSGSGKPSTPSSSRARADDTGSEEDECVILEVYDPIPISYAFPVMPVSADPERQVVENAVPLSAMSGAHPTSRARKTPASDSSSGAAPTTKRRKVAGAGPSRDKKKSKAIPTSTG
jgi:hypothetical protein